MSIRCCSLSYYVFFQYSLFNKKDNIFLLVLQAFMFCLMVYMYKIWFVLRIILSAKLNWFWLIRWLSVQNKHIWIWDIFREQDFWFLSQLVLLEFDISLYIRYYLSNSPMWNLVCYLTYTGQTSSLLIFKLHGLLWYGSNSLYVLPHTEEGIKSNPWCQRSRAKVREPFDKMLLSFYKHV